MAEKYVTWGEIKSRWKEFIAEDLQKYVNISSSVNDSEYPSYDDLKANSNLTYDYYQNSNLLVTFNNLNLDYKTLKVTWILWQKLGYTTTELASTIPISGVYQLKAPGSSDWNSIEYAYGVTNQCYMPETYPLEPSSPIEIIVPKGYSIRYANGGSSYTNNNSYKDYLYDYTSALYTWDPKGLNKISGTEYYAIHGGAGATYGCRSFAGKFVMNDTQVYNYYMSGVPTWYESSYASMQSTTTLGFKGYIYFEKIVK